jgi:hypothetical protein
MKITVTTNELRTMAQVDANIGQRLFNRIAMSNSNLEVKVLKARAEIKEEINGIELWYDNSKHEVSLEISEEIMLMLHEAKLVKCTTTFNNNHVYSTWNICNIYVIVNKFIR